MPFAFAFFLRRIFCPLHHHHHRDKPRQVFFLVRRNYRGILHPGYVPPLLSTLAVLHHRGHDDGVLLELYCDEAVPPDE